MKNRMNVFIFSMFALMLIGCTNPLAGKSGGTESSESFRPGLPVTTQSFGLDIPFTTGTESSYLFNGLPYSTTMSVDFLGDKVRLKPSDQTDDATNTYPTTGGFMSGASLSGVQWDSTNKIVRLNTSTNTAEFDASWTPQWSNLYGYWKMNFNWNDATGNSKNGIVAGNPTFSASTQKLGTHSGSFSGGSGNYVYFNNTDGLNIANTTFSFSLWFKTTAVNGIFLSKGSGSGQTSGFSLGTDASGYLTFVLRGTNGGGMLIYTSNTLINDGNWHNIVGVVTTSTTVIASNTASFYLDGRFVSNVTGSGTFQFGGSSTDSLAIGARGVPLYVGPAGYYTGELDDLAFWSVGLTAPEAEAIYSRQSARYAGQLTSRVFDAYSPQSWKTFSTLTTLPFFKELPGSSGNETTSGSTGYSSLYTTKNLTTNLVGLWHLNEATGTTAATSVKDKSGLSTPNDGSPYNGVVFGSAGRFGSAASFDGTDDYIDLGTDASLNIPGDRSISVWIYPTIVTGSHVLLSKYNSFANQYVWRLEQNGNTIVAMTYGSVGTNYIWSSTPAVLSANQWHHVTLVYDATSLSHKIYVNGVSQTLTEAPSGTFAGTKSSTFNTVIGRLINGAGSGGVYFKGLIDEVAIWKRTLDLSEIQQLYRRGANRIKYQIRSCDSASCANEEAATATGQGWKGPGNTHLSYFSELYNTTSNILTGTVSTSSPTMNFENFSGTSLTVSTNRYFQYRAILESDDVATTLCTYNTVASSCSPELQSVSAGPIHYDTTVTVTSKASIGSAFKFLDENGMTETLGANSCSAGARYSLSSDGMTFYYWSGADWSTSTEYATANDVDTIRTNLSSFPSSSAGTGILQIKTFLKSTGTSPCEIDGLYFTGKK